MEPGRERSRGIIDVRELPYPASSAIISHSPIPTRLNHNHLVTHLLLTLIILAHPIRLFTVQFPSHITAKLRQFSSTSIMSASKYDAIVIGSGQAGNPLAIALAKCGKKTAI